MKNKTILKALAALTVGSAAAFGLTLAGCNNHEHTYSDKWTSDKTNHWHAATCEHTSEKKDEAAHVDADNNGKCDVCNYTLELPHEHAYDTSKWESDATKHWHAATCGHDVKGDEASHTWGTGDSANKCTVCGYEKDVEPPHQHTYSEDWTSDDTNHWHVATCNDLTESDAEYKSGVEKHVWGEGSMANTCIVCDYGRQVPPELPGIIEPTLTEADDEEPVTDADGNIVSVNEFNPADIGAQTLGSAYTSGIFTVLSGTTIRGRNISSVTDVTTNEVVANPGTDGEGAITHSVQMQNNDVGVTVTTGTAGTLRIWVSNGSSGASSAAILINGSSYPYGTSGGWQITYEVPAAGTYTIKRDSSKNGTSDIYFMSFTAKVPNTAVDHIVIANGGTVDYYVGQEFDGSGIAVNAIHEDTGRISAIKNGRLKIDYTAFDNTKAGTYDIKVYYTKEEVEHEETYQVNVYDFNSITLDTKYTIKESSNSAAGNGVYATHWLKDLYLKGEAFDSDGLIVILNGTNSTGEKSFTLKKGQYTISSVDTSTTGKKTVTVTVSSNGITKTGTFEIFVIDPEVTTETEVLTRVNENCTDEQMGVLNTDNEYQFKTVRQALEFYEALNLGASVKKTINLDAGNYWEKLEVTMPNVTIVGAGADTTKIEYNELWGKEDATGFTHTTDSTATLNVRDKAEGFTIKGVTISNYYNNSDAYQKGDDGRALAMLIQADKVVVQDCVLLGWQDTLELFTGRQYFVNCLITGTTDFIFGSNNTTYFYNCEIRTVVNKSTNSGGYITAMKGQNKGSSDKVTYGVIFDNCDFTCESGVPAGTTAIGRTWGADAAVMIMNSRLGAHITTTEGNRYIIMNKNDPAKAQFMEYNNTGAGSVSSTASNKYWTVPSDEIAANYNNSSVIFGKTNGNLKYDDIWSITLPGEAHKHVYGDWTITAPTTENAGSAVKTCTDADCDVDADKTVTVALPALTAENATLYNYRATETEGIWTYSLKADKTISFEAAAIEGVHLHNYSDWEITEPTQEATGSATRTCNGEGECDGLLNLVLPVLTDSRYVITNNTATLDSVGTGTYTIELEDETITFEAATPVISLVEITDSKTIDLLTDTINYEGNAGLFKGMYVDATSGKFALNGTQDWVQFNTDTVITLKVCENATVSVTEYNNAGSVSVSKRDENGIVTITATGNTYLSEIIVTVKLPEYADLINYDNLVYSNDFSVASDKLPLFSGIWGAQGVYSYPASSGSYDENYVKVESGVAQQVAKGNNVSMIVDFGPLSGNVKGYFELTASAMGSGWNIITFYDSSNNSVFAIRAIKANDPFGYLLKGESTVNDAENSIAAKESTKYAVYFDVDLNTGKITVAINGIIFVEDLDANITDLAGVQLIASNSGGRLLTIDNIAVTGSAMEVADYQTLLVGKLKDAYDKYDLNDYTTNGENLTATYNAEKDKISAAETLSEVYQSYIAGLDAMAAIKTDLQLVKEAAIAELDAHVATKNQDNYPEANWAKLLGIQQEGKDSINAASSNEAVATILGNVKDAIDAVPDNSEQVELNARDKLTTSLAVEKEVVQEVVVANLSAFNAGKNVAAADFTGTFLTLTTVGSTKYKAESGVNGLSTNSSVYTFTTSASNAVLVIDYYSTNSSRYLTIKQGNTEIIKVTSSAWKSNNDSKIVLPTAGEYTISFTDGEHKIASFSLTQVLTENQAVVASVNSLDATVATTAEVNSTIESLVSKVTVGLDYNGDTSYTEDITAYTVIVKNSEGTVVEDLSVAGEYTVLVINGENRTEENATKYNSKTYNLTVTAAE